RRLSFHADAGAHCPLSEAFSSRLLARYRLESVLGVNMAGKSGRGKNRGRAHSSSHAQQSNAAVDRSSSNSSAELPKENGDAGDHVLDKAACDGAADESKVQEANAPESNKSKQGEDVHLYPVSVKTQSGEKLELQLNPGDSVMDIRQFLLDAPETCFFTCYDLILHTKDGSIHHLEDYHEIAEIADITSGGCSLEMIGGLYDERSIRAHVRRARELLSLSSLHSSLSTTYALQHETNNQTVTGRAEVPELDGLGFMEEIAGSLDKLSFSPSKETKCVESIVFSSFNPVPSHRRLVGDLVYLDIETLEGHKVCITGTTRTFYVNSSLGSVLDPRPTKNSSESFTLIGLLQKISPKFKKGFREILDQKAAAHPFESVQSLLPPNSWLGTYPIPEHKRDAARAEDSLVLSYGSELIGMQRDWNEELQSCREFPHNSFQERILRDRALYKVTCDFVDAATKGAIGVINRCIPPINPTDPECFHMYVHNNIFFSFAVDSDLSQMFKSPDNSIKSKSLQDPENDITSHHEGEIVRLPLPLPPPLPPPLKLFLRRRRQICAVARSVPPPPPVPPLPPPVPPVLPPPVPPSPSSWVVSGLPPPPRAPRRRLGLRAVALCCAPSP
ncbi:Clustered mitochondria protein, partial [Nymphaea thermarum]